MKNGKCLLICAGDIALTEIRYDKEKDMVIAVDGGYLYCKFLQMEPDLIIGDFDSIEEEHYQEILVIEKENPDKVIRLKPEKNDTDTLAALRIALDMGYTTFQIHGGLGGRLEHIMANTQCLLYLRRNGAKGYIMGENSMITVIEKEPLHFRKEMEGFVSIFSMGDKAIGVTIKGLKYPLENATITNDFPIGISNEFIGEEASISVEDGALLVITTW